MKFFLSVTLFLTFYSLYPDNSQIKPDKLLLNHIRNSYKNLPKLMFPFYYDLGNPKSISEIYSQDNLDSLIFGTQITVNIVGVLRDTTNFFAFLYLFPGDELIPSLVTFDKNGKLLERNFLAEECGAGCGYVCQSTILITKDLRIISKFNETITKCEKSKPIDSTRFSKEKVEISQLGPNGKISLLDKKTKIIK